MLSKSLRSLFRKILTFFAAFLCAIFAAVPEKIFAENSPEMPPNPAHENRVPEEKKSGVPAAKIAPEPLFYSVSANESVFIKDKEALSNSRISAKVLQGNLDVVILEIFGNGNVEQVNGDAVKDWSLRRSGARNFLEIRPNKTLSAGETFDATIVGKTTLELPATILPPIFAGTDAISFNVILRIFAA